MFGKECSLCGGKLRGNICIECGLDNSKNDSNYEMTRSHYDYEKLTHTHESVNPFAGKTLTDEQRKEMKSMHAYDKKQLFKKKEKASKQVTRQYTANIPQKKKSGGKKAKLGIIVTVIILLFNIFEMIMESEYLLEDDWGSAGYEEVYYPEDDTYDPYGAVQYELTDTGDYYGETLTAGSYKGGVHIPEGIYEVILYEGEGRLTMEHDVHGIYQDFLFGADEEYDNYQTYIEDFRVYKGARIEIEEGVELHFETNSAVYPTENMANPNTESAVLEDWFVVGEDIPAGVYDVICLDGSGIFDYTVDFGDGGYTSYEGKLIGSGNSSFPSLYKNVVLPEGTEVGIEGMTVELVPSEIIESEDYLGYYQ